MVADLEEIQSRLTRAGLSGITPSSSDVGEHTRSE